MKTRRLTASILGIVLFVTYSNIATADNGNDKTASCVSCHGLNGVSSNPKIPNIAGQKEAYLIKSLKDYRDKKRTDVMMNMLSKSLSDDDISKLAAYYSKK